MKLPKIVQDGVKLISGNIWAQAIAFAAYLILARIYTPQDFTVFNIFYSYIEVLIIVSTCKYELSIIVASTEREAAACSKLALRLNTLVSIALLLLIVILHFTPLAGRILLLGDYFPIALMIPLMVFFCGTSRVYASLFNRFKQFGQIALSEVITSTAGVAAKILLAFSHLLHGAGLPLGTVIGKMAGNINYLCLMRRLNLPKDISAEERRTAAARHRNFPLYNMPKELLNSFSYNLPFLWLALYFDKDPAVGLFGMALTFTFRPVNILNSAFEKLLFVRIAEKVRQGESIRKDISRFLLLLNATALPLFGLLFLCAEPLFGWLFGAKWTGIGYYIRCLLPWVFVALSATSISFLANVFNRQRGEFLFYVAMLLLRAAAVVYGIIAHDYPSSILLFSIASAAVVMVLLVLYLGLVWRYEKKRQA